jgi:polyhydroxyalkanoate synthesis regulator phasin
MIELMKKTMMMGFGLAAMTRDKVEELAREMAKQADLSAEKGQEFVNEVMDRAEKARGDFESSVQKAVNEQLKNINIATREDVADLTARLEKIEQALASNAD